MSVCATQAVEDMDGSEGRSAPGVWQIVAVGMAMFLGIVIAAVAVAKAYVTIPSVGDIVAIRPATEIPEPFRLNFAARRVVGGGDFGPSCVLEAQLMAERGGSLVVETRKTGGTPTYLVHWAGGPTSRGATDCGGTADLELDAVDLQHLAEIAGGLERSQPTQPHGAKFAGLQPGTD